MGLGARYSGCVRSGETADGFAPLEVWDSCKPACCSTKKLLENLLQLNTARQPALEVGGFSECLEIFEA